MRTAVVTLLAVVVTALLLTYASVTATAAVSSSSPSSSSASASASALPSVVVRCKDAAAHAVAPVVDALRPYIPAPLRQLAPPFLHGAVSVVMVGRAARQPPASVNGASGDALLSHTTAKFIYAAGAIASELTLLRLVYREPYRNLRRNPMNRFFCSPAGFALLVLLTAAPIDFVDTSLLCVFWWKLSGAVYTPAIVCGQLLRVYAAALVPRLPTLSAAYAQLRVYGASEESAEAAVVASLPYDAATEARAEVALAAVVVASVLFAVTALRGSAATMKKGSGGAKESDGDDYYEE